MRAFESEKRWESSILEYAVPESQKNSRRQRSGRLGRQRNARGGSRVSRCVAEEGPARTRIPNADADASCVPWQCFPARRISSRWHRPGFLANSTPA